ncbi:6460_t:CDS:2 [Rhizophagus irregularis]|nr:6460_t:CDS:2 [Rhizophagus irregularis]
MTVSYFNSSHKDDIYLDVRVVRTVARELHCYVHFIKNLNNLLNKH